MAWDSCSGVMRVSPSRLPTGVWPARCRDTCPSPPRWTPLASWRVCQRTACMDSTWNTRTGTSSSFLFVFIWRHPFVVQSQRPSAGELATTIGFAPAQPHPVGLTNPISLPDGLGALAVWAFVWSSQSSPSCDELQTLFARLSNSIFARVPKKPLKLLWRAGCGV